MPPYCAHEVEIGVPEKDLLIRKEVTLKWKMDSPFISTSYGKLQVLPQVYYFSPTEQMWRNSMFTFRKTDIKDTSIYAKTFRLNFFRKIFSVLRMLVVLPITFRVQWTVNSGLSDSFTYWSWSGIYFVPVTGSQLDSNGMRFFRREIKKLCMIPDVAKNLVKSLPACPPTERLARLSNSGFEEEDVTSLVASNMYNKHYYNYFYNYKSFQYSCFISQVDVARYASLCVFYTL